MFRKMTPGLNSFSDLVSFFIWPGFDIIFSFRLYKNDDETNDDERNAQKLSHIKRHCIFKSYLGFFKKFDQESYGKKNNQKTTENKAGSGFAIGFPIIPVQNKK